MDRVVLSVVSVSNESQQIGAVRNKVRELLQDRLGTLYLEATNTSADLECLVGRLVAGGHKARVDDVFPGTWVRAATEVRLLQDLYTFICDVSGVREQPVPVNIREEMDG